MKASSQSMKPTAPLRNVFSVFATTPPDFVSVPGFSSAIRVFALTHSRRIVFRR
jgi:hypothetical protein